ncbi:MFS transporter [Kineococcus siccus]|uniref:MFS transporter n=1 Tax=Kineococcus siccus TaxID=2696567 RepID=UPI0030B818E5
MTAAIAEHVSKSVPRRGSTRTTALRSTFGALAVRNYRIYVGGQAVANTGTWIQNIALDWLVLQLTGSPAAVGIAMALQFTPILFLGMHGGMLADRFSKRTILMTTQVLSGVLAGSLAVMTLTGRVSVGFVYVVALVGGVVFAVDNPTRQVFVSEVVPARYLRNAVALNAAVFQSTRLVGPAVASILIGTVGSGWAFGVNALCYLGPTVALAFLRTADLTPAPRTQRARGQLRSALRHVADRPHVAWTIALVGVFGTFGLNFPVVLTAMAGDTFGGGAGLYGTFNIVLAVGSIAGALIAGSRTRIRLRLIVATGAAFGLAQFAAALAPTLALFVVALVAMGVANLAFQAMANSSVQLSVDPEYRGRVMGLYMLVFIGGTPLGAPLVGWVTEHAGVRAGMALCGLVPMLAAVALGALLSVRVSRARAAEAQLAA